MPDYELLNPQQHKALKMQARLEQEPHFVRICSFEFAMAAISCPIMLTKDPESGEFIAGVVLSLKNGEAPLKSVAERGGFVPLSLQCDGFYISGESIAIDRSNPRFNENLGDALFNESQQPNTCLREIQTALGKLNAGINLTKQFLETLEELKIIEPVDMSLSFDNGEKLTLQGLYTASLDRVQELDDPTLLKLVKAGHLEQIYTMANSLKQFNILAQIRNNKLSVRDQAIA